jgi:aminopeptidase N
VDFPTVIYGDYYEAESGVKVTRSDGTQIPVRIYVDKVGLADWEISPKALGAFADEAANAINLYSAVYGVDYPYAKLDLVNDPRGGLYGQAPSSIVYLGAVGFRKAAIASSGGGQMSKFVKSLVAHETAHQWWGSVIGNANYRNYWFVESLAEYSAALFVENVYSRKEYLEHVQDWRRRVMETDIEVSVQDAPVLWGGDDFGAYQAALYNKGPYVFHVMRSIWGDEKFFAFLKTLAQELKGKEIVTRDIQKVAEKAFGGTMDWFFDQWIRSVGVPEYTFTHTVRATEDGKFMVEGEIQQRLLYGIKKEPLEGQYFTTVVPITVTLGGGKEVQFKLKVEGPKTPFKFKVGEQPLEVVFNKYGEVLAYDIIKG